MEDSCQDRQENEKAALMAIYGQQIKFNQSDREDTWAPLECVLKLWPPDSHGIQQMNNPSIDLHITCSADYPHLVPNIDLEQPKRISNCDIALLRKDLLKLAQSLKGEVMIFELAQYVENALSVYSKPHYESFYEEMISRKMELQETELLKRQADEEKKLNDIKLKIQSEQQAVRKALRKKTSIINKDKSALPKASHSQEVREMEKLSKDLQVNTTLSKLNSDEFLWNFSHGDHSRFKNEFEYIKWLGKGAFGDVLKVRNKLDDGFYAIKRIELNPYKRLLNKKITREVKLLSRLNHENVVRYYNSWIEVAHPQESTFSEEMELEQKEPKKTLPCEVASIQNKKDWSADKGSDCSYDDSSDCDTWISFRADSKTSTQQPESKQPPSIATDQISQKSIQKPLHLYIQMELCEKSTLRIAIDESLYMDSDRVWRLFREIVEGLCHIHQQGIIHRDLKPVNIFIGLDDHVKIGDFGLATTIILQKHSHESIEKSSQVAHPTIQGKDVSHTGQIGTAFYVAPELNESVYRTHYNEKVDIFSLGIILFEMCNPPFDTTMERCKVLSDIRLEEPIFPSNQPYTKTSRQFYLIRWMLQHDSEERPSSQEVLQSELVPPPQLEEAEVKEMVRRTLSNPQSKDYKYLVASCFNQDLSPTLDATFNVSSWRSNWFTLLLEAVTDVIRRIMKSHGAISFLPPLFTPVKDPPETGVALMTRLGGIVYATFDIRTPFVRFLKYNPGVCHMKRYAIDKVYRERPAGVHPKEAYECALDIVTSIPGDLMPEFELIATTWELLCEFPTILKKNTVIRICHSSLFQAVLAYSGLDRRKCDVLSASLFKPKQSELESSVDIESKLRSHGIGDNIISSVMNFFSIEGTFRDVASKLKPLMTITGVSQALQQLETLIGYCHCLEITCPLIVSLRLVQNTNNYSGIMFQVTYEQLTKQKPIQHTVISGGRYDKLLKDSIQLLTNDEGKMDQFVAGFILSIDKLIISFNEEEKPSSADLLLCSMGPIRMTPDRLTLIKDLWKSGLKTVFSNSLKTLEEMQSFCENMSVLFIVILKETEPGFARVRSLMTEKFADKKVPFTELLEYIKRSKFKTVEINSASLTKVRDSPLITFVLTEKINPAVKRRYETQVVHIISPALQKLSSNVKVEVLVLSLDSDALHLLSCCLNINASQQDVDIFLKRYPRHRKYVQKIVNHLDGYKQSHNMPVIVLYSLQDSIYKVLL